MSFQLSPSPNSVSPLNFFAFSSVSETAFLFGRPLIFHASIVASVFVFYIARIGVRLMDGAMGQEEDVVEAVLTCEGDFHDPELFSRIEKFRLGLKDLLLTEKNKLQVKKVEPWNSVKVTLTIPRDAASRLRQLACSGNDSLRQMGILSVQIQGDTQISLRIAGRNNEPTEFVLRTPALSTTTGSDSGFSVSNDLTSSPGPSNDEITRKNIVDYLRQGSSIRQNAAIFDTILGGMGTSSTAHGLGLSISQHSSTFQNPSLHSASFRPNSVSCIAVQNPGLRGSSLRNSFPFTKSTGAFHPPVPRLPASAGQSPVNKLIQPGTRTVGQPAALGQVSHVISSSHTALPTSINNFNPVNSLRLPASQSPNFHSQNTLVPSLSSSPTSAMLIDLPPPPPYPHNNNSRPGKPVTASSPLLVNLLQTDPLMVAAGNASGNPNKPLSLGDSDGPPPKKKKRSKKSKDGLAKPFSLTENLTSNNPAFSQVLSNSGIDLNRIARVTEDSCTINLPMSFNLKDSSVDVAQPRTGVVSHISDSFIPSFRPDSKPSFLPDRPFSECHKDNLPLSKFQLETSRSAIGVSNVSSKHSDSSAREHLPKDMDPFNLEVTAGKIVNPYTGQLEPRDSVDFGLIHLKDQPRHSIGDNFATQMLAKKAKEMDELNKMSVPISSSHMDVHVGITSPTSVTLSNSTAGLIRSGGPIKMCNDKLNSIPPHRRNFISDGSAKDLKHSTPLNIYAVLSRQDITGNVMSDTSSLTLSLTNTSHKILSTKSTTVQKTLNSIPGPFNGPLSSVAASSSHSVSPSHLEFMETSGASSTPSGSVIYSSNTSASLPISQINLSQPLFQQTVSVPLNVEAARVRPTSSVTSHHSKSVSSPSNASDRTLSLPNIQNQAASTDIIGNSNGTKLSSSNLLNSFPEKHMDSPGGTESPAEKISSEGDDNSNHSGLATDSLPENSGAAALLEHSGVKAENHDSGLGSSSERSDDTPSEPGDSEFRPSNMGAESEENSKTQLVKSNASSCKLDSKLTTSITVGYMMNPSENISQSKMNPTKYSSHSNIKVTNTPARTASSANLPQFMDIQIRTNEKQNGQQLPLSVSWPADSKSQFQPSLMENADLVPASIPKLNGPSSTINLDKMLTAVSESQQKKMRSSPKQNIKKDIPTEHMKLQTEVIEKISKIHQFTESSKLLVDAAGKSSALEKADSPETISRPVTLEEKGDHLIFDMEELVNGRTLGNGSVGIEGKGGSNITSIYSKRSSPVNVNMLNHIYAPGLPLPRRLTESVQRLVKPLPASESSAAVPQVRACKSPAAGSLSRAMSTTNGSSNRVSFQSGTRSPGASMPKLVPNDKYSLLSGGLDLAGLSSLQYSSSSGVDSIHAYKPAVPVITADLSFKDNNSLTSPLSPSKLVFDGKSFGNKMLSQSYPPHKYRESSPHLLQEISDQNNSISTSHFNQFSKFEISTLSQERHLKLTKNQEQNKACIEASSSLIPTKVEAPPQATAAKDSVHSSHDGVDISIAFSSHSNASSPVMPVLQQGQESAINFPSISSHPSFHVTSSEISQLGSSSSTSSTFNTSSTSCANSAVPCTSSTLGTSSISQVSCSSPGSLPTLYPMPVSYSVVSKAETTLVFSQTLTSKMSSSNSPTPPSLTKVSLPCNPPPLSPRISSHNRNLFESVSSTLTSEHIQSDLLASKLTVASSTLSLDTASEWLSCTIQKKSESDKGQQIVIGSALDSDKSTSGFGSTHVHKQESKKPDHLSKSINFPSNVVNSSSVLGIKNTSSSIAQGIDQDADVKKLSKSELNSQDSSVYIHQTPTSPLIHDDNESLNYLNIVSEKITSVATGADTTTNKQSISPAISQVKEPILETIASSLGTTFLTSVPRLLSSKSTLQSTDNITGLFDNTDTLKVDSLTFNDKLTLENNVDCPILELTSDTESSKPLDNIKPDSNPAVSQTESDAESSIKRVTRKRKSTHSEGDTKDAENDNSSIETTPVKQASSSHVINKQSVKSVSITNSKLESCVSKPFKDVGSLKTYSKASNLGNGELQNKIMKVSASHTSDERDVARQSRPLRTSLSEEKEAMFVKERKHSSSNDSREILNEDTSRLENDRFHGSAEDKEVSRASSSESNKSPHKDGLHKENRSVNIDDQKESCNQITSSLDEKIKSNKDTIIDKSSVQGSDEGHKKNHRIKRQFYAYVPEKSIDQTYFDTPILSGRTRSKNKPAEQNMETGAQDGTAVNECNHVESPLLISSGKGDMNLEGGSAKRPTRSVRSKDNPQDQSAILKPLAVEAMRLTL
ncbi:hypothetical protein Btru_010406 [Bulinus truncatus]|nr:hypothetical protein Btru_010406 [Bulinus truncatus]